MAKVVSTFFNTLDVMSKRYEVWDKFEVPDETLKEIESMHEEMRQKLLEMKNDLLH